LSVDNCVRIYINWGILWRIIRRKSTLFREIRLRLLRRQMKSARKVKSMRMVW
jgi:hypothetical protein